MFRHIQFRRRLAAAVGASFVFLATPHAMANDTVALKNALYGAGYAISNVSPQMDDTTRSALTEFQKENGLSASGELDEGTKKALGMISIQVAVASNSGSQSAAASEPEPEVQEEVEDDIKEDDDGGWSLF